MSTVRDVYLLNTLMRALCEARFEMSSVDVLALLVVDGADLEVRACGGRRRRP